MTNSSRSWTRWIWTNSASKQKFRRRRSIAITNSDLIYLGVKTKEKKIEINATDYAAYLLREGTLIEKRELLSCLKSKLILKDKKISLE